MTQNMGTLDRGARVVLALGVAVLYASGQISGTIAAVLGVLAVVFVATSLVGWCPLYLPLGLTTLRKKLG